MKSDLKIYINLILMSVWVFTGCVKEDRSDCPPEIEPVEYRNLLVINVEDVLTGADITGTEQLDNVTVFLFDAEENFIDDFIVPVEDVRAGIPIDLTDRNLDRVTVTVWSNLSENVSLYNIPTRNMDEYLLRVSENPDENGYFNCPGDLFFGYEELAFTDDTRADVIDRVRYVPIRRINGRLAITVRGLELTSKPDQYFFRISTLWDGYDFEGDPLYNPLDVKEAGVFNEAGEFVSPEPFMMVHSPTGVSYSDDNSVKVCVHRNNGDGTDTTLAEALRDRSGQYIRFEAGRTTNVLIEFSEGELTVSMILTDWNEIYQWQTW